MDVSVITPVFNVEAFLEEAVASALAEPEVAEILLVEDGSGDGSREVCSRLVSADPERLRLLQHEGGANRGAAASRNLGISSAKSELVAFLDADDRYLPGRFRGAVEILAEDRSLDGTYAPVTTFFEDEAAAERYDGWEDSARVSVGSQATPETLFETLCGGIPNQDRIHTNGVTVRRELFERTGLFDEHLELSQDSAMWFKMAACGRIASAGDEPVAEYRVHGGNRAGQDFDRSLHWWCEMMATLMEWGRKNGVPAARRDLLRDRFEGFWHQRVVRLEGEGKTDKELRRLHISRLRQLLRGYPVEFLRSSFWADVRWNLLGARARKQGHAREH